jgi:hypothetical protein
MRRTELKESLNRALLRTTGYQLTKYNQDAQAKRVRRAKRPLVGERLVKQPTFILCSIRSGSTLLRVLLNSHSQIHAPQEMHLRYIGTTLYNKYSRRSMHELGLGETTLQYLLWDRIVHRELQQSGKSVYVNKTPNDVFIADRILECWPDARFIFLLRHPGAIARSRQKLRPSVDPDANAKLILRYCRAIDRARETYPGLTVRYEDVTADPARETQRICEFLGVEWEPGMVDYGDQDHGPYRAGLGDWAEKIKTGAVQAPDPAPSLDEIPEALHPLCVKWGYVTGASPQPDQQTAVPSAPPAG